MASINYQYLLGIIEQFYGRNKSVMVLDYGCGRGEIVRAARLKNINIYGAEVFHSGPAVPQQLDKAGLLGDVIREIRDGRLQFPDQSFDLIICNQVFEHVRNLDDVLKEIHRVLKPGGFLYALFPSREIFREGHTGIPFLHWFSNNKARYYYALVLRNIGFGSGLNKPEILSKEWVKRKLNYIDTKTFYRNAEEIRSLLDRYFIWNHQEEEIINFRAADLNNILGAAIMLAIKIPGIRQLGIFLFTRLAGYLIVASPK